MVRAAVHYETRHASGDRLDTHRHVSGYAALVVQGTHTELSIDGPVACTPGALLVHPGFHAHGNRFGARGARVLNLGIDTSLRRDDLLAVQVPNLRDARAVFIHRDLDALRDLIAASVAIPVAPRPWQAAMLEALRTTDAPVRRIAADLGISAAHATRGMTLAFGMGPAALRREFRWRHALLLLQGNAPLAEIALAAGFSDQSHFNRVVRACSGLPPSRLRLQVNSIQDSPPSTGQDRPGASAHLSETSA